MADEEIGGGEETQHDQLPAVDEILIEKPRDTKNCRRILVIFGIVLGLAAVFAVGLVVGLEPWKSDEKLAVTTPATDTGDVQEVAGVGPSDDDGGPPGDDKSNPANAAGVNGEYMTAVELVTKGISLQGGVEFENESSYQSKALNILKKHAVITNFYYTDQKIAQRYALLCLYFRTYSVRTDVTDTAYGYGTTPPWKVLSPWKYAWAEDECSWYGIACNMLGLVVRIELPGHLLTGYIPMELKHLAKGPVTAIDFSGNRGLGQGGFPAVFTEFDTLDYLGLSGCNFDGEVPESMCKKETETISINCGCKCSCCTPCF